MIDMDKKRRHDVESIHRILELRARRTPNKQAYGLLDENFRLTEITYAELLERASALSSRLAERKLAAGSRCLLMFHQSIEFIVAFFACLRAGAVPVPVNMPGRNRPLTKWEGIARNAQVSCILTDRLLVASLGETLQGSDTLAALPLYAEEEEKGAHEETTAACHALAFLQYTSGSTGEPKGVMVTHAALLSNLRQLEAKFAFDENSVMVSWLPFYHDMGLILGILQGVYSGYKVILMKPADFMQQPAGWLRAVSVYGATHTGAPNFAYRLAADKLETWDRDGEEPIALNGLRRAFCGAEPIDLQTLTRFANVAKHYGFDSGALSPGYGLAEASLVVATYGTRQRVGWLKLDRAKLKSNVVQVLDSGSLDNAPIAAESEEAEESGSGAVYLVGNGFVIDGHRLSVRHTENRRELGERQIGEVVFSGPSVTQGYWNRPVETDLAFPYDERSGRIELHTGDLGFRTASGELYITGRMKDLIIIQGMNYYPQDIERTAFEADPDLRPDGAAAFSVDRGGEEKLIVIQEANRSAVRNPQCERWAARIRDRVRSVHDISVEAVVFVPPMHIPRTTSGKIQRGKAKLMYENNEWAKTLGICVFDREPGYTERVGAEISSEPLLERYIVELVAEQLAVSSSVIDGELPFMELGLTSAMALSVRHSLERATGLSISATALFNYNTAGRMSRYLFALLRGGDVSGDSALDERSESEWLELLKRELGGEACAN